MNYSNQVSLPMQKLYNVITLTLLGALLLFIRNPDPIFHPVLYAEDGVWAGQGLCQGWVKTLFLARPDYLVAGNVILLWISTKICYLLFGNPIKYLPESIALISYLFYSSVGVLAFYTLKGVCNIIERGFIFMIILMMPLGNFQNEVIGRLNQIGFFMPFIAILLLYIKSQNQAKKNTIIIDFTVAVCMATNPLVSAITILYIIRDSLYSKHIKKCFQRNIILLISIIFVGAINLTRMLSNHTTHLEGFDRRELIEFICARSINYPITYPWYFELHNLPSLLLTVMYSLTIIVSYVRTQNTNAKQLIQFLSMGLIITTLATLVMRPGLTTLLHDYSTSFPDRYFMGINIFSISLLLIGLAQINIGFRQLNNFLGRALFFLVIAIYLTHLGLVFETYGTKFSIMNKSTFLDQVKNHDRDKNELFAKIPITPEDPQWYMSVPKKWAESIKNNN